MITLGLYLSFLGVDGIGKSTLARAIADELERLGATVRFVSWRSYIEEKDQPAWPSEALQQLWLETFRLLHGGSRHDGQWLSLPRNYGEWRDEDWEERLGDLDLTAADPSGPLAAALVELAGNFLFSSQVIRPMAASGEFVVQETFPFKHTLKEVLIARQLAGGDPAQLAAVARVEAFLETSFASPQLHPDVGILLDGPVELAYQWRMAQNGRIGLLEDYGAAGDRGKDSFLALQRQTAEVFREASQSWGWLTHTVDGSGLQSNLSRGVALAMDHPAVRRALRGI